MKRLIFIACLLLSFSASSLELILGGFSKHIGAKTYTTSKTTTGHRKLNNKHNLLALGHAYGKITYGISTFKNSYYTRSNSISCLYKLGRVSTGLAISTGYNDINRKYLKYQPSIVIKYDYKNVTFMSLGNALSVSFRLSI